MGGDGFDLGAEGWNQNREAGADNANCGLDERPNCRIDLGPWNAISDWPRNSPGMGIRVEEALERCDEQSLGDIYSVVNASRYTNRTMLVTQTLEPQCQL